MPQSVRFIDSWEDVPGATGQHPAGTDLDTADAKQSLRQLVELGYIDEPNPDRAKAVAETSRELRFNLAQAYADGGRWPEAAELYRELWETWPDQSRFGTRLLSAYLAMEEPVLARATYELILERKQVAAANARAALAEMAKEREAAQTAGRSEAEARGEDYVAPKPSQEQQLKHRHLSAQAQTNPRALAFFEGSLLALENRLPEAIAALRQATEVETALQPSLQNKIGNVYFKLGDLPAAEIAFLQVLEAQPDNPDACLGLAKVCMRSSRPLEAAAHAKSALDLGFAQPRAHTLYGVALFELGKPGLAAKSLRTALALNPWNIEAHETMAKLHDRRPKGAVRATYHRTQAEIARQRIADSKASVHATDAHKDLALPAFPTVMANEGRLTSKDGAPVVVVSGLPRSGTSLLMQMLTAAGVTAVTDAKRVADESNPQGYFEDERVKRLPFEEDRAWLSEARGHAIKIMAPLLHCVPADLPLKIVFMQRPPEEVIASQHAMLKREGKTPPPGGNMALARGFSNLLARVNQLLDHRPKWELLPVSFHDAVHRPERAAAAVAAFLNLPIDSAVMAEVANPALHRTSFPKNGEFEGDIV